MTSAGSRLPVLSQSLRMEATKRRRGGIHAARFPTDSQDGSRIAPSNARHECRPYNVTVSPNIYIREKEHTIMRTTRGILERLKAGTVIGAEGYVFELERRGYIKAGPYVPEVVLDFPEAVKELHREFLRAGADVMVALTYYAHREKLKDVGRENDLEAMNRQAVQLANEVAREGDALVAGNICNTWAYDPDNAEKTGKIVRAMYEEQLTWAADEGIDFVISETNDYLGEALIALDVIKQLKLPAMV